VPLAEEHKKAGNIETAIFVLMEGLKHNPGYVTARSFLGRLLMDKGDLTGAQKELEEVIKTIPDNLLAQRKLGDIYVLQGRGADALPRYRAALALNPGDKELPSILADLEAGKEVSSRIPRPKTPAPPADIKPQTSSATPIQPKAAPVEPVRTATTPQPGAATLQPAAVAQQAPVAPGPQATMKEEPKSTAPVLPEIAAATVPQAPPAHDEPEIIEDIVEIESLDQTAPGPESKALTPDTQEPVPFDLSEPLIEKISSGEEKEVMTWDVAETAVPEPVEQPGPVEGRDDLNTNTLAELYISQGFYDKAIEIYQGMLNDRPGNMALQQKLEQIRAMAGTADKGRGQFTDARPGPREYTPPATDTFSQKESMPREQTPQMTVHEPSEEPAPPRGNHAAATRRKETIDRLESWLNTIMKEKQE
jgi:tetratricopeptide (TPR) repeat protein